MTALWTVPVLKTATPAVAQMRPCDKDAAHMTNRTPTPLASVMLIFKAIAKVTRKVSLSEKTIPPLTHAVTTAV